MLVPEVNIQQAEQLTRYTMTCTNLDASKKHNTKIVVL